MISAETVTRTWKDVGAMPPERACGLVERMRRSQPVILAYLMAVSEQPPFNADEREIFFYIGVVVWHIMEQSPRRLRKVTKARLDEAEAANEMALEQLIPAAEADLAKAAESVVRLHPEPKVLGYIVEAIMGEDTEPDDPRLRRESRGMAFLCLKTVLDAFVSCRR